jgi:hypothetical protein
MMAGVRALRKLQLGRETTMGTAVAATTRWRGRGTIDDDRPVVYPDEDVGIVAPTERSYIPKIAAFLELEPVEATFEQLLHIYEMGIKTVVPVQDGAGTDYISAYPLSTTALNTPKAYTVEGGDDQQAEEMEYSLCEKFSLTGVTGEAMMMGASLFARQAANTTFTGALSNPSVEEILFSKTKLYLDNGGGTIGDTLVSNILLEMKLDIVTGVRPVFTSEGNLYFTSYKIDGKLMSVKLGLVYEHTSDAVTEKSKWRDNDLRLLRLLTEGDDVGTAGTVYSKKTHIIDIAGKYTDWAKLGERDGNDVCEVEFTGGYSSADSLYTELTSVHELVTIP